MSQKKIDVYVTNETMNFSIKNLDELHSLLKNVEECRRELDQALEKLSKYDLKVTLSTCSE